MLYVRCPHCNAKLKAPDELAGRRGRCPDCRKAVSLPKEETFDPASKPETTEALPPVELSDDDQPAPDVQVDTGDPQLEFKRPENLRRNCHYLICNSQEIMGRWDDDGKGWMIKVRDGFVKAVSNSKQIPSMGNYTFIEIEIVSDGPHQRLAGVHSYTLPGAFALQKLAKKNDNAILEAIDQRTELNDRQRALVRQRINSKYLPSIWDDAAEF